MISLFGSLLGFGSSLIGPVLEAWNKSSDQKHELAMLHAQAEIQSKIQDQKLEATIVESDMAEIVAAHKEQASTVRKGPQWLAALSGSVRPVVTYLINLARPRKRSYQQLPNHINKRLFLVGQQ